MCIRHEVECIIIRASKCMRYLPSVPSFLLYERGERRHYAGRSDLDWMVEEMVALYEHVPLFHFGLSFSLISPRLILIIHHRCFKMINPFYLFPVRRINVALPHPSARSMEMSPLEKIYITSVDV